MIEHDGPTQEARLDWDAIIEFRQLPPEARLEQAGDMIGKLLCRRTADHEPVVGWLVAPDEATEPGLGLTVARLLNVSPEDAYGHITALEKAGDVEVERVEYHGGEFAVSEPYLNIKNLRLTDVGQKKLDLEKPAADKKPEQVEALSVRDLEHASYILAAEVGSSTHAHKIRDLFNSHARGEITDKIYRRRLREIQKDLIGIKIPLGRS